MTCDCKTDDNSFGKRQVPSTESTAGPREQKNDNIST